ncbi:MAG: GGDEF domain-containing protein [Terriglobia bacterium]
MRIPPNVEHIGPQARIQAELARLESQRREFWVLVVFSGAVLLLGVLSFFFPSRFWLSDGLHVSISPQALFVIMVATVLASLAYIRREAEVRGLRLLNLHQYLSSQEEQAASMIDAVTNVFSRGILRDLMMGEISRAERTNRSLALIMCDLDNFKQVNDAYGHLMGDYVLSQIAAILKSCVRGSDYVVRYGGDEFLLLLPETDEKGAEFVCQRVHSKVAEWDRTHRVGDLPISVSLGLHLHMAGQTADKDIAEVDARMYAEKQAAKRADPATSSPRPQ